MIDGYNKLYGDWEKRWKNSQEKEQLSLLGRRMFKSKIKSMAEIISDIPVQTVIEVGCGLGYTLDFYCRRGFDCIGIDIAENAVACCKNKGLPVIREDLENIDEKYDLVSSDGMLEHFMDFQPYARHLMRISRNYVLLIQPNHDSFVGKTLVYLSELIKGDKNVFEYNFRINDFITVFSRNGFDVVKNIPVFQDVFRILLFQKRR
ncbi:class I SAM-dependent methyltransferase [Desulfobacula phenolica]|uniref:Methyltransferase domain-containing protein n=1 Tax=Desulfobacula phenolica TaxID=90732 RepID=A0A1H2DS00_9BACT|nr:class I SAM-dependent methyltransferase [Desulfobacula phenolica]SDT85531.1 Methyltransferase domain-containing protein [Desulfobacula phenolica]